MVANLIKDGAGEQVLRGNGVALVVPGERLPAHPTARLRVAREEKHFAGGDDFNGEDEAGVVGGGVELQGHGFGGF